MSAAEAAPEKRQGEEEEYAQVRTCVMVFVYVSA
jgi:hypothetical protein